MDCPDELACALSHCCVPSHNHSDPKLCVLKVPVMGMPISLKAGLMEPVLAPGLSLTTYQQGCSPAIVLRWAKLSQKAAGQSPSGAGYTSVYHKSLSNLL